MSSTQNDNFIERRNEWVEDNFPSADQILTDSDRRDYINEMDEDGHVTKHYLPEELQWN